MNAPIIAHKLVGAAPAVIDRKIYARTAQMRSAFASS